VAWMGFYISFLAAGVATVLQADVGGDFVGGEVLRDIKFGHLCTSGRLRRPSWAWRPCQCRSCSLRSPGLSVFFVAAFGHVV
jgi:hypothetical protein